MPAQRNLEIALKEYVDRYFALEQSERDKDYAALMQLINNVADGAGINTNAEGSGLRFDTEKSALVHSNQLNLTQKELGETGCGSGMYIPTIKWDSNGHITEVTPNKLDDTVTQNSINGVLSGAVFTAIEQERIRAQAAEQQAIQTALAAGTEYSFVANLASNAWSTEKKQKVYNAKITGAETEVLEIDILTYEGYVCGVQGVEAMAGWVEFECTTIPSVPIQVRIIIKSTVSA